MLRTTLTAILIYCVTLSATAQSNDDPPPLPAPHREVSEWPDPAPAGKLPYFTLDIISITHPTTRQHCKVREVKVDSVICSNHHHQPDTIYHREDILALIEPPAFENLFGVLEFSAVVAASLAASFFVPFAWSLTLRLISGFFFFGGWAANGLAHDQLAALGYSDHRHDILLYQHPNISLAIQLR